MTKSSFRRKLRAAIKKQAELRFNNRCQRLGWKMDDSIPTSPYTYEYEPTPPQSPLDIDDSHIFYSENYLAPHDPLADKAKDDENIHQLTPEYRFVLSSIQFV